MIETSIAQKIYWEKGMTAEKSRNHRRVDHLLSAIQRWEDTQSKGIVDTGSFNSRLAEKLRQDITSEETPLNPATLKSLVEEAKVKLNAKHLDSVTASRTLTQTLVTPKEAEAENPTIFDSIYGIDVILTQVAGELSVYASRQEVVDTIQKKYVGSLAA
jgi:hypothetical protein